MIIKAFKWFLGVFLLIVAALYFGGMLLSPKFVVARSVSVQAPPDKVYPLIASPRQWKQWSVWNQRDPAMEITYDGPESGPGAKWTWKSKSQGDGAMTFREAVAPQRVAYELYFPDFGTTSTGDFVLKPEGAATRVTWTMNGDMGHNPMFRWMALFADSMVGRDFEDGLAGLKRLAEK